MYVILGHFDSNNAGNANNVTSFEAAYQNWYGVFVEGGEYAVDAFFCMAAFLATYVMLGKLAKSKTGCMNVDLAYFHRWYRLVPALALATLVVSYLFPWLIHGPMAGMYYY